jgi:hypothetical protein
MEKFADVKSGWVYSMVITNKQQNNPFIVSNPLCCSEYLDKSIWHEYTIYSNPGSSMSGSAVGIKLFVMLS